MIFCNQEGVFLQNVWLSLLHLLSPLPCHLYGETGRTLRQRFSVHLRGIEKELLSFPVAELFNTVGHSINDAWNYALRRKRLTEALKG